MNDENTSETHTGIAFESPAPQHAKEFGAHLVYGAFVAVVTQALQRLFAWR
jgi:hypothetical protein